ncbi:MAG: benzoate-CoA ligase family protein [Actinomycetes bacterium]
MTVPALPERYNVATILDANLEAGRGGKVAIRGAGGEVTYEQLLASAGAAGRALRALGVQREQRVMLVLDDTPAFPAAFLGAIRAGIVPVPVNPLFKPDDYAYLMDDSDARVVVVDLGLLGKVREALAGHPEPVQLVTVGGAEEGTLDFDELLAEHAGDLPPARTHRDDPAFWLYSSGSTGRPKGVVHLQHDLPYTCQTYAMKVLGIREDDICLSTTKQFHAYGLGNLLSFPFWVGATAVHLFGRPAPDRALEAVERYRPTLLFSVPTLYNAMLASSGAAGRDLSSVRLCVSAAESLPAEIWRRWKDTYGLNIIDGIGSTEMLHIFCSNAAAEVRPGSSGRPVPGYDLKLLDETLDPTPPGETGNLYVRGDSALALYWRQHDKTKQTVLGDWIYTGDRYRCDADGFWWHQGRVDDMLKVGGNWVSPVEMEQTLGEHPAVHECAVVQVPVQGLTRIKAVVVPAGTPADPQRLTAELQEWCKQRLQRYEYPHIVEYATELPKTTTGKVQRYKLRAGAAAGGGDG